MKIGRSIGAVLVGVVVAGAVLAVVEMLLHSLVEGDALFVAVAFGYGLGAIAGTLLTLTISPARLLGIITTVLLAALALSNLFIIEHPVWFAPLGAILLAIGWWIGNRIGLSRMRKVRQ